MTERAPGDERSTLAQAIYSLIALLIALLFFFPIYWAVSNSLRTPAETMSTRARYCSATKV